MAKKLKIRMRPKRETRERALQVLPRAAAPTPKVTPLPKITGMLSAKQMNKYLDDVSKQRARYDHRVAQNAEDHILRTYVRMHKAAAHGLNLSANRQFGFFPGLADLPIPRLANH